MDKGEAADVEYLDFSKAFDTVMHDLLINKQQKYKLDRDTIRQAHNWMDSQKIVINGSQSCYKDTISGVSQG